jgi:hypothetical protein
VPIGVVGGRDEVLIDVHDVGLGHQTRMRWNDPSDWIWSEEPSHDPLVTLEEWEAVQARFRSNKRRYTHTPKKGRHYLLAGRLSCGQCGRRTSPSFWKLGASSIE